MTCTYVQARFEMFEVLTDAWNSGAAAVVGYVPELRFQGVEEPPKIPVNQYWARVSTKNEIAPMSAFVSDDAPTQSARQFTNRGNLFVQVFAPMSEVDAFEKGGLLCELAQGIFQKSETPSGVWFRNARIKEVPNDGKAYQFNVVVEYEFDQLN